MSAGGIANYEIFDFLKNLMKFIARSNVHRNDCNNGGDNEDEEEECKAALEIRIEFQRNNLINGKEKPFHIVLDKGHNGT